MKIRRKERDVCIFQLKTPPYLNAGDDADDDARRFTGAEKTRALSRSQIRDEELMRKRALPEQNPLIIIYIEKRRGAHCTLLLLLPLHQLIVRPLARDKSTSL